MRSGPSSPRSKSTATHGVPRMVDAEPTSRSLPAGWSSTTVPGRISTAGASTRLARSDQTPPPAEPAPESGLRLLTYRPLFSGPAVERTPELDFQRAGGEVELARADARARGIGAGDTVTVSSNGTSVALRARIARDLEAGTVRIALPDAGDLHATVEVRK